MPDKPNDKEEAMPHEKTQSKSQTPMAYAKEKMKNYIERQEKKLSQKQKLAVLWTLIALYGLCLAYFTYDVFTNNQPAQIKYGSMRPMTSPLQTEQKTEGSGKEPHDPSKLDTTEAHKHQNPKD